MARQRGKREKAATMKKRTSRKKTSNAPPLPRERFVTIGSGMTEKTFRVYGLDDLKDAPKVLEQPGNASSVGYDREVARARRTLEGAGFPTDPGTVYPSPDKRGTCILLHLIERSEKKEEAAPEWYAAKILQCWHEATKARAALEQGAGTLAPREMRWQLSQLQRYMGKLGETVATERIKFPWEKSALIGKGRREKQSGRGKISGEKKRTAAEKKWEPIREEGRKIAEERKKKGHSHSKNYLAGVLKKKLKLDDSIRTIRANI